MGTVLISLSVFVSYDGLYYHQRLGEVGWVQVVQWGGYQ